jgi:hypothetical protein
MKLNDLLKFLTEASVAKPEAPKDAPLGQYLFAPHRADVPDPKEENTSIENDIFKDLGKHYKGADGGSKKLKRAYLLCLT